MSTIKDNPTILLKIMLSTLLNLEEATLNETKQIISHQSFFFILTGFNKKKKLISSKLEKMII
jgi:hypothetical protein